jgi:large subunit ribosomal protein L21
MYAIVSIKDHQFRVEPDAKLQVPQLEGDEGTRLSFDQVLLFSDGTSTTVGTPQVSGCTVTAEILRHGLAKKVNVFKKKRRKNYRRNKGHRQPFTEIRIVGIGA